MKSTAHFYQSSTLFPPGSIAPQHAQQVFHSSRSGVSFERTSRKYIGFFAIYLSRLASLPRGCLHEPFSLSLAMPDRYLSTHLFKNRLTYNPSCRVDSEIYLPHDPRLPIASRFDKRTGEVSQIWEV